MGCTIFFGQRSWGQENEKAKCPEGTFVLAFYDVALYSWGDYSTSQGHYDLDHTLGIIITRLTEVGGEGLVLGNLPGKYQSVLGLEQCTKLLAIPWVVQTLYPTHAH